MITMPNIGTKVTHLDRVDAIGEIVGVDWCGGYVIYEVLWEKPQNGKFTTLEISTDVGEI